MAAALLAAAAVAGAAGPAHAATIDRDDGGYTYTAAPGEGNGVVLNPYQGGLRFNDVETITSFPDGCERIDEISVACEEPTGPVRVELLDRDDTFSTMDLSLAQSVVVSGGAGADKLSGDDTESNETFEGGAGDDILEGLAGDDVLRGGPGGDKLWGGAGNDELRGEDGEDQLKPDGTAPAGDDVVDGGPGFDLVDDWVDTAAARALPVSITLDGVANDGRAGESDNVISIEKSTMLVSGRFELSDGADEWHIMANLDEGDSTVLAGGGDDRIMGDDHRETIDGGAGNDHLEGGKRNDVITGGPGADTIFGDISARDCTWAPEYCLVFGDDVIDARDGEADDIDCGPGADRALVDAVDAVAGCEAVEVAGASGGPGPANGDGDGDDGDRGGQQGTPGGNGRGGSAPARLRPVRSSLAKALRSGLRVRITGAQPGPLKLTARQGRKVVATGRGRAGADGAATVRLRFTKAARRSLRAARSATLTIALRDAKVKVTLRR